MLWAQVLLLVLEELRAIGRYAEAAPDVDFTQGVHEAEGASALRAQLARMQSRFALLVSGLSSCPRTCSCTRVIILVEIIGHVLRSGHRGCIRIDERRGLFVVPSQHHDLVQYELSAQLTRVASAFFLTVVAQLSLLVAAESVDIVEFVNDYRGVANRHDVAYIGR